jgi:hypothetical protein
VEICFATLVKIMPFFYFSFFHLFFLYHFIVKSLPWTAPLESTTSFSAEEPSNITAIV